MKCKILFTITTLCLLTCLVWLPPSSLVASNPDNKRIGNIDFFGYGHLDVVRLRAVLPIRPGESIEQSDWSSYQSRIDQAIRSLTGKHVTDVERVCCDENGNSTIYIGVAGGSSVALLHKWAPKGDDRLPTAALTLNQETEAALKKAVLAGRTQQDSSNGYALSIDPEVRALQLKIREFALANEDLLRKVLSSSSDAEQRAIAAEFLGYVNVSARQIADLTDAARDPDEGVRNNAVRALGVIASSSQERAAMIPPKPFIALLKSDKWVDRNKGAWLLINLTQSRDPKLLKRLRKEAMEGLVEMARWHFAGHASSARRLLGRIAGIDEARLNDLVMRNAQVETIVEAAQKSH